LGQEGKGRGNCCIIKEEEDNPAPNAAGFNRWGKFFNILKGGRKGTSNEERGTSLTYYLVKGKKKKKVSQRKHFEVGKRKTAIDSHSRGKASR